MTDGVLLNRSINVLKHTEQSPVGPVDPAWPCPLSPVLDADPRTALCSSNGQAASPFFLPFSSSHSDTIWSRPAHELAALSGGHEWTGGGHQGVNRAEGSKGKLVCGESQ